jgi:hypothetical protein
MSKRSVGRVAVRLYPREIRDGRGKEILGTLLDAGDASFAAFLRQLASIVVGGLVARSRRALTESPVKLTAGAACWAAIILVTQFPFRQGIRVLDGMTAFPLVTLRDMCVLPLVILASFTFGGRRLAGLLGLAWIVLYVQDWEPGLGTSQAVQQILLPAAGFGLLTLRPQAAPRTWQARILWVVPAAALALVNLAPLWASNPLLWYSDQSIVILIPVIAALAFLPVAPAFAVGTTLAWSSTWVWNPWGESIWTAMLMASTPTALALLAIGRFATRDNYD